MSPASSLQPLSVNVCSGTPFESFDARRLKCWSHHHCGALYSSLLRFWGTYYGHELLNISATHYHPEALAPRWTLWLCFIVIGMGSSSGRTRFHKLFIKKTVISITFQLSHLKIQTTREKIFVILQIQMSVKISNWIMSY